MYRLYFHSYLFQYEIFAHSIHTGVLKCNITKRHRHKTLIRTPLFKGICE